MAFWQIASNIIPSFGAEMGLLNAESAANVRLDTKDDGGGGGDTLFAVCLVPTRRGGVMRHRFLSTTE
jgi:hypothetical protein